MRGGHTVNKNRIVTISREFGSGGRTVGKMVAEELGIPFYDKQLIALVAKESGFSLEFVEETGEYSTTPSLLFNIAMTGPYRYSTYSQDNMPLADRIQVIQNNIIREIAEKEPCVIVGRSADYILRDRDDVINVFIHADMPSRIERAIHRYGIPEKNAAKDIERKDKARKNHYRHYTGQTLGDLKNYHLTLDSGKFGLEMCRDLIVDAFNHR